MSNMPAPFEAVVNFTEAAGTKLVHGDVDDQLLLPMGTRTWLVQAGRRTPKRKKPPQLGQAFTLRRLFSVALDCRRGFKPVLSALPFGWNKGCHQVSLAWDGVTLDVVFSRKYRTPISLRLSPLLGAYGSAYAHMLDLWLGHDSGKVAITPAEFAALDERVIAMLDAALVNEAAVPLPRPAGPVVAEFDATLASYGYTELDERIKDAAAALASTWQGSTASLLEAAIAASYRQSLSHTSELHV